MIGRPPKYSTKLCEQLIDHMASGLSYQSFAGVLRINPKTLYDWEKSHPEWVEAKAVGKALLLLSDETMLQRGISGTQRGYNVAAHKWKMANVHRWTERQEIVSKPTEKMKLDELKEEARKLLEESDDGSQED